VNFLAGDTEIGGGWLSVLAWNARKVVANPRDFAALLRCVVFIGETALCLCFNFKSVVLRAICGPTLELPH